MAALSSLPPELLREVLRYLPIRSLLNFGLTSKVNHTLQACSLSILRLGVFHSRLGGMISLMEATMERNCLHSVQIVLPRLESRTKNDIIFNQNLRIRNVIDACSNSLSDLEVALWELQESSASSIAKLRNLKRLSIRLDHPHTRISGLDPQFWATSPGSPVWNHLAPRSRNASALGRLQGLTLERAGITDYQLAIVLERNPLLTELRLFKCLNLTDKTFKILAESKAGQSLELFHFTNSCSKEIDERILEHIGNLLRLKSLSLHGCDNIDSDLIRERNDKKWHIADLVLPSTPSHGLSGSVEVDYEYK